MFFYFTFSGLIEWTIFNCSLVKVKDEMSSASGIYFKKSELFSWLELSTHRDTEQKKKNWFVKHLVRKKFIKFKQQTKNESKDNLITLKD